MLFRSKVAVANRSYAFRGRQNRSHDGRDDGRSVASSMIGVEVRLPTSSVYQDAKFTTSAGTKSLLLGQALVSARAITLFSTAIDFILFFV